MPVYNTAKFLSEAIASILQQTLTDIEFLIVDDGSHDGSSAIIEEFAQRDARIRFIQHPVNRGEAVARNTGMAHAAGTYVAAMDSDDVSLPQRLEKQVAFLNARPRIGAVGVIDRTCDRNLKPIGFRTLPSCHHAIVLHELLLTKTGMRSGTMMIRREFLAPQPVYDPSVAIGADEHFFLRLLRERSIRYANLQEELYLYRNHANSQTQQYKGILRHARIQLRCDALRHLGEPGRAVESVVHKHPLKKLSWNERRLARRDITRLIGAMVEHNWVDAEDEPLLYAEMNPLLESTTPRRWQMFLHWYRYRIARHLK